MLLLNSVPLGHSKSQIKWPIKFKTMAMRRLNPPLHRPGELIDDDECHCCMRIGRSHLICGKKNSHFPYTCFVSVSLKKYYHFISHKVILYNRLVPIGTACV